MAEGRQAWMVEGAYLDAQTGCTPITGDLVVAASEKAAIHMVGEARHVGVWLLDRAQSLEDYLVYERQLLDKMESMSLEEIEADWQETRKCL